MNAPKRTPAKAGGMNDGRRLTLQRATRKRVTSERLLYISKTLFLSQKGKILKSNTNVEEPYT